MARLAGGQRHGASADARQRRDDAHAEAWAQFDEAARVGHGLQC
jgi:hypothetical protein